MAAKATEAQVIALEKALAEQFFLLVQAAEFRIGLARQYGLTDKRFLAFDKKFKNLMYKWFQREAKYEKITLQANGKRGIILQDNLIFNDFLYSANFPRLLAILKKWNAKGKQGVQGMGWVALVVFAVVSIIALVSGVMITDDLTTTTEEREDLLNTTAQTVKDLGLTNEQAAALMTQTQAEAGGSGFGGLLSLVPWAVGGWLFFKFVLPMLEGKKSAA